MTAGAVVSLSSTTVASGTISPFDGPRVVLLEVGRLGAELLIGLHVDAIGAVVEVEVVDVLRAEQHRQRVGHLADRQAQAARAVAIDLDDEAAGRSP